MYPRLTRPKDFREVYQKGKLRFGRYMAVHLLPAEIEASLVGISVSKKVGKAVTRNVVKRRLREAVASIYGKIPPGYHVVIGAKAKSREATFWELQADLFNIMKGLGLIKKNNRR